MRPPGGRLDDLRVGARLLAELPAFLRRPIAVSEAQALVRGRLASRETGFLTLLRHAVFPHPDSPYRKLLDHAGATTGTSSASSRARGWRARCASCTAPGCT